MMSGAPSGSYRAGPLAERPLSLLRCARCAKDIDTGHNEGRGCKWCGSRKWSNAIGRLTLRERIKIYRETKIWVMNPDWIDKVISFFNRENKKSEGRELLMKGPKGS